MADVVLQRAGLLDLPYEIRHEIYEYILQNDTVPHAAIEAVRLVYHRNIRFGVTPRVLQISPPIVTLLSLNRQIRAEALPLFWKRNKIFLQYQYEKGLLRQFDSMARCNLQSILLHAGAWVKPPDHLNDAFHELVEFPSLKVVQVYLSGRFLMDLFHIWAYPMNFVMGADSPCTEHQLELESSSNMFRFFYQQNPRNNHCYYEFQFMWTVFVRDAKPLASGAPVICSEFEKREQDEDTSDKMVQLRAKGIDMTRLLRCDLLSCRLGYIIHKYAIQSVDGLAGPDVHPREVTVPLPPTDVSDLFPMSESIHTKDDPGLFGCLFPPPLNDRQLAEADKGSRGQWGQYEFAAPKPKKARILRRLAEEVRRRRRFELC